MKYFEFMINRVRNLAHTEIAINKKNENKNKFDSKGEKAGFERKQRNMRSKRNEIGTQWTGVNVKHEQTSDLVLLLPLWPPPLLPVLSSLHISLGKKL